MTINIFFDVDQTLLGTDGTVRPHAHHVLAELVDSGHAVYVWSGVGVRGGEMAKTGLAAYLSGIYQKPQAYFETGLERYNIPVVPDFVVDDHAEIVEYFGGYLIPPYTDEAAPDDALMNVLALVAAEFEQAAPLRVHHRLDSAV